MFGAKQPFVRKPVRMAWTRRQSWRGNDRPNKFEFAFTQGSPREEYCAAEEVLVREVANIHFLLNLLLNNAMGNCGVCSSEAVWHSDERACTSMVFAARCGVV